MLKSLVLAVMITGVATAAPAANWLEKIGLNIGKGIECAVTFGQYKKSCRQYKKTLKGDFNFYTPKTGKGKWRSFVKGLRDLEDGQVHLDVKHSG